ncbi:hypothetical protein JYU34_010353 [Plutella xylostella]|uniref:Uncharacterized protein n=1 Tax=Plutella xylostella TaxID=51655 RepID=A0ABQ7QJ49_PLUXY|nr:hypothetical protein JYU34_010353 [Plutella xylostella]
MEEANEELPGALAPAEDELQVELAGGQRYEELQRGEAARAQMVQLMWASR